MTRIHHHTTAFVLKTVAYSDRDVIVTLLGKDTGRFTAIAKSARTSKKRFAGGLQPLRCLNIAYTTHPHRDLATLVSIDIHTDFPNIEASFEKITIASYFTELCRELGQEGDCFSDLFELLNLFLHTLEHCEDSQLSYETILRHFELRLLNIYGALPSLYACARCGLSFSDMHKLFCSRSGEGLICHQCRHHTEAVGVLAPYTLALLHKFLDPTSSNPLSSLSSAVPDIDTIGQARRVIHTSIQGIVSRDLKSKVMLQSLQLI